MKKYPKYQSVKTEVLEAIPVDWKLKRLKYLVKGKLEYGANEIAESEDPDMPRYIRITDFGDDGKLRNDTFKSLPIEVAKDYLLQEGDILFARSGATVGKTFQFKNYDGKACFAGYLIRARPSDIISSDYLYYFTRSANYENWKNSIFNQATIQNIGADKYNQLEVCIPLPHEQNAIVAFLDSKTSQIDTLIRNKQKLIELIKEERAAIINQAVTKGIDPNAKMKDSGVEWLGVIPENWSYIALKHLVATKITDGPHETPQFVPEGIPFASAEAVFNGKINLQSVRGYISKETDSIYAQKCKPKRKDIFIVKSGSTTGKIAMVDFDDDFNVWSPLALIRVNKKISPEFAFYALSSEYFQNLIRLFWSFGTQPNIGMNVIENLRVAVPPTNEQPAIVSRIIEETTRIDAVINKVEKEIELLHEYRTALISEVVTGKVCVI